MSKTAEHTPGPLAVTAICADGYRIVAEDGTWVASVAKEQDAELFAAAPDLLAALEAVAAVLDGRQPIDGPGAVMVARAAIDLLVMRHE